MASFPWTYRILRAPKLDLQPRPKKATTHLIHFTITSRHSKEHDKERKEVKMFSLKKKKQLENRVSNNFPCFNLLLDCVWLAAQTALSPTFIVCSQKREKRKKTWWSGKRAKMQTFKWWAKKRNAPSKWERMDGLDKLLYKDSNRLKTAYIRSNFRLEWSKWLPRNPKVTYFWKLPLNRSSLKLDLHKLLLTSPKIEMRWRIRFWVKLKTFLLRRSRKSQPNLLYKTTKSKRNLNWMKTQEAD